MKKSKKAKNFIQKPKFPGGKTALGNFIKQHLQYPEEAKKNQIEGDVEVSYQVNGLGEVVEAHVVNGIGYGCDQEALRLVKSLPFEKANNRGLRVLTNMKVTIHFRLPKPQPQSYQYQVVSGQKTAEKPQTKPKKSYSYTITWGSS